MPNLIRSSIGVGENKTEQLGLLSELLAKCTTIMCVP